MEGMCRSYMHHFTDALAQTNFDCNTSIFQFSENSKWLKFDSADAGVIREQTAGATSKSTGATSKSTDATSKPTNDTSKSTNDTSREVFAVCEPLTDLQIALFGNAHGRYVVKSSCVFVSLHITPLKMVCGQ